MALKASELKVGDTYTERLVEDLKRTQVVMYAGASGDYNPVHTDELFTTKVAGYPGVFAHGMLTMGMTGMMLTNYVGDGRLTEFGVRFTNQVFPGDTLDSTATVTAINDRSFMGRRRDRGRLIASRLNLPLPLFNRCSYVNFERPCVAGLSVEIIESVNDSIDANHAGVAEFLRVFWESFTNFLTADRTVDNDVADVNTVGPVFLGHGLGEDSERRFTRVKCGEASSPPHGSTRTRE